MKRQLNAQNVWQNPTTHILECNDELTQIERKAQKHKISTQCSRMYAPLFEHLWHTSINIISSVV